MNLADYVLHESGVQDIRFGLIDILYHRDNPDDTIFCKTSQSSAAESHRRRLELTAERLGLASPYLLRMLQIECDDKFWIIKSYFVYPANDLRGRAPELVSDPFELVRFVHDILSATAFLESKRIVHGDVRSEFIFYDTATRKYVLADRLGSLLEMNIAQYENIEERQFLYMSPQLFDSLMKNNMEVVHNPFKSEVFSVGMLVLDFFADEAKFQGVYDMDKGEFDVTRFSELVAEVKRNEFSKPENRMLGEFLSDVLLPVDEAKRYTSIQALKVFRETIWKEYRAQQAARAEGGKDQGAVEAPAAQEGVPADARLSATEGSTSLQSPVMLKRPSEPPEIHVLVESAIENGGSEHEVATALGQTLNSMERLQVPKDTREFELVTHNIVIPEIPPRQPSMESQPSQPGAPAQPGINQSGLEPDLANSFAQISDQYYSPQLELREPETPESTELFRPKDDTALIIEADPPNPFSEDLRVPDSFSKPKIARGSDPKMMVDEPTIDSRKNTRRKSREGAFSFTPAPQPEVLDVTANFPPSKPKVKAATNPPGAPLPAAPLPKLGDEKVESLKSIDQKVEEQGSLAKPGPGESTPTAPILSLTFSSGVPPKPNLQRLSSNLSQEKLNLDDFGQEWSDQINISDSKRELLKIPESTSNHSGLPSQDLDLKDWTARDPTAGPIRKPQALVSTPLPITKPTSYFAGMKGQASDNLAAIIPKSTPKGSKRDRSRENGGKREEDRSSSVKASKKNTSDLIAAALKTVGAPKTLPDDTKIPDIAGELLSITTQQRQSTVGQPRTSDRQSKDIRLEILPGQKPMQFEGVVTVESSQPGYKYGSFHDTVKQQSYKKIQLPNINEEEEKSVPGPATGTPVAAPEPKSLGVASSNAHPPVQIIQQILVPVVGQRVASHQSPERQVQPPLLRVLPPTVFQAANVVLPRTQVQVRSPSPMTSPPLTNSLPPHVAKPKVAGAYFVNANMEYKLQNINSIKSNTSDAPKGGVPSPSPSPSKVSAARSAPPGTEPDGNGSVSGNSQVTGWTAEDRSEKYSMTPQVGGVAVRSLNADSLDITGKGSVGRSDEKVMNVNGQKLYLCRVENGVHIYRYLNA